MTKANHSWIYPQEPAQPSPSSIHMSSTLPYEKQITFPSCMNPCVITSSFAFPGFPISALPELRPVQANGVDHEVSPCLPSLEKNSLPIPDPFFKDFHPSFTYRFGMNHTPNELTGCNQKSFMIFDQSRDQTQMFFSALNPTSENHVIDTLNFPFARQVFGEPTTQNLSYENYIVGEGSEGHEDTDEINALLYSDDDDDNGEYDDNDDDGGEDEDEDEDEDDEVTSTGQSPFSLKRNNDGIEEVEDSSEDLGAYDDGSIKRRKLLDGGYQKSLVQAALYSAELNKSYNQENDAESCCVSPSARTKRTTEKDTYSAELNKSYNQENDAESCCVSPSARTKRTMEKDTSSFQDKKQSKKDKKRKTLKILESIISCSNHKDPLLIIEEAINHLKLLKVKAKALGVC